MVYTRKTYGVNGLMEWQANIKAGKTTFKIPFTGGAMTAWGVTPAEYTTDNPIIQHAIEASSFFTSGRIVVLRTKELAQVPKITLEKNADKDATEQDNATVPQPVEINPEIEEALKEAQEISEVEVDSDKTVKVTGIEDAAEYLHETYGIAKTKLRTKQSINDVATAQGIVLVWE